MVTLILLVTSKSNNILNLHKRGQTVEVVCDMRTAIGITVTKITEQAQKQQYLVQFKTITTSFCLCASNVHRRNVE